MKYLFTVAFVFATIFAVDAQTAVSLFRKSDSLQVKEVVSEQPDICEHLGHEGPAIENTHMALRLFFNDSGAIDVYSKSGRGMELLNFKWYPDVNSQIEHGAGCDVYEVANTLGLGGVALWDGQQVVRLVATKGRTAKVGETRKGKYAEIIAYGVEYKGSMVDISIRIDVVSTSRQATITASELSGKMVQFVTGVNYHKGQTVEYTDKYISVWGKHPVEDKISAKPISVGAGMFYSSKVFPVVEKTDDMVRLISKPSSRVRTKVISSSTREAEINTSKRFGVYMAK